MKQLSLALVLFWARGTCLSTYMWTTALLSVTIPTPIADVTSALHSAADALEDIGFTVSDRRVKQQVDKVIGYVPLASPALVKPPAPKLALLHLSRGELLAQDSIYVPLLKSIIGSWLRCMLLNRNLLSIGHSLFQFLDRNAELTVKW